MNVKKILMYVAIYEVVAYVVNNYGPSSISLPFDGISYAMNAANPNLQ